MKKKILVVLLALAMLFAFSASALADGNETTPAAGTTIQVEYNGQTKTLDSSWNGEFTFTEALEENVTVSASDFDFTIKGAEASDAKFEISQPTINKTGHSTVTGKLSYLVDSQSYEFTVNLDFYIGNNNANLASITPTDCDKAFDDTVIKKFTDNEATIYVAQDATKWSFEVAAVDKNATIKIDDQEDTAISNGTKNEYKIVVVSENEKNSEEYTLKISNTYDLAEFTADLMYNKTKIADYEDMNDGDRSYFSYPYDTKKGDKLTFSTEYVGELDFDIDSTDAKYISVRESSDGFTVTFDRTPDGRLDIDVILTALDGDSEVRFTLRLDQAEPVLLEDMDIEIDGDDNDINYDMYPSRFDDETFDYYIFVPYDGVSNIDVKAQIEYDRDYDANYSSSSSKYHKLGTVSAGKNNTFTIKVEDKSGNYSEYNIHVYYGAKNADDDATLDDIEVRYGSSFRTKATISPSFSANTTNYVVSLPAKTEEARLYLDASDRDATILCNNVEVTSSYINLTELKTGENTFQVVVIADNCDDTKTYKITVNVGATGLLSNVTFTTNAGTLNFSPVFASGVYNYVANVANSVTSLYVTPTAIDSDYRISVYKGAADYQTVNSGKTSKAVTLSEGLNEVKIYVSQSGSSKTYTLNIYRQPANPNYQVSVQKLYVNGISKTLNAVNIKGNNFLKLRDLAYLLDGTSKQFNVTYTESTNTAHIQSLTGYVNDPKNPVNQPITLTRPQLSSQKVTLDGKSAYPITYNVAGSNYVNLRQVCAMLDIGLTYSASTNTVAIVTTTGYTPDSL